MTHILSREAQSFLANDHLQSVARIKASASTVPVEPGIYGWWFDDALLPDIEAGALTREGRRLLYVGIAPSAPPQEGVKARTLRARLANHCRGPIATSTLRRTIVALTKGEEAYVVSRSASGKLWMSKEDEARLTAWMDLHARVSWMTVADPWRVESELLEHERRPRLPLNIRGSSDPFRFKLLKERADLNESADNDPGRFFATAEDIKPIGKMRTIDHLTDEERAQNAEHDRIVKEATVGLGDVVQPHNPRLGRP